MVSVRRSDSPRDFGAVAVYVFEYDGSYYMYERCPIRGSSLSGYCKYSEVNAPRAARFGGAGYG